MLGSSFFKENLFLKISFVKGFFAECEHLNKTNEGGGLKKTKPSYIHCSLVYVYVSRSLVSGNLVNTTSTDINLVSDDIQETTVKL